MVTAPTAMEKNTTPTEQKNELLLAESIFSMDVNIIPIGHTEDFSTSFAQLPNTAAETYSQCATDERQMDRVLVKEMSYYATSLLWKKSKARPGRIDK
jgi:hypothetical protein